MDQLNYFALYLNNDNFILKCLSLIRFICNPKSKSIPHITLRVAKESLLNEQIDSYFNALSVKYIKLLGPGQFNVIEKQAPYIVYMQCESLDMEIAQYKPDFPFSRLHITLYEGDDVEFAKHLYKKLEAKRWGINIKFDTPQQLIKNTVGKSLPDQSYALILPDLLNNILSCTEEKLPSILHDSESKLEYIELILSKMEAFCDRENIIREEKKTTINIDSSIGNFLSPANTQISMNPEQFDYDIPQPVREAIFITPPEIAYDMAFCAMQYYDGGHDIDFGDPTVGTGNLFLAFCKVIEESDRDLNLKSALGVDIDRSMATEAANRCRELGLIVKYGDSISPKIDLQKKRNFLLANPPYNRHEDIPADYRTEIKRLAHEQTGINISGEASLYVYHMLIMDKWLEIDGIAAWLIPNAFLQSRYGMALRQYLINNVQLLLIHTYDEDKTLFQNANVIPCLVLFKKCNPDEREIKFTYGNSARDPRSAISISRKVLLNEIQNWRSVNVKNHSTFTKTEYIKFSHIFDIKRGMATGANSFFVLKRITAKQLGIPDIALKPILPKARYLTKSIIEAEEDGYPNITEQYVVIDCDISENEIKNDYPSFYAYLCKAKEPSKKGTDSIVNRTLVKSRKPWYKQETRSPAPYLITYMGRNKLYCILNKSRALALNTYILLYPREWVKDLLEDNPLLYEELLDSINATAEDILIQASRVYSGSLHKIEPGDLKELPILHLPKIISQTWREFKLNEVF